MLKEIQELVRYFSELNDPQIAEIGIPPVPCLYNYSACQEGSCSLTDLVLSQRIV